MKFSQNLLIPLKKLKSEIYRTSIKWGSKRQCNICQNKFRKFTKYKGGSRNVSEWIIKLDVIGSDVDQFGCIYCGSHDRERHLVMFFDRLDLWRLFPGKDILHIAPEQNLSRHISKLSPKKYVLADLHPFNEETVKIDLQNIPFQDNSFDVVICNHVLEHIPDHMKAIKEVYRVLKPSSVAILQTPYSMRLTQDFCDEGINTDELRLLFYGQEDHVRLFSRNGFLDALIKGGFSPEITPHNALFDNESGRYYGVNIKEELILAHRF